MLITLSDTSLTITQRGEEVTKLLSEVPANVMSYVLGKGVYLKPGTKAIMRPIEVEPTSEFYYWFIDEKNRTGDANLHIPLEKLEEEQY